MVKLVMESDEVFADETRKPVEDDRVNREVISKSGELELKEWVLTCETWDEVVEFIRSNGGIANIEVGEEGGMGAIALLGS